MPRSRSSSSSPHESPKRGWRKIPDKFARVVREIRQATQEGRLWGNPRDLINQLGVVSLSQEELQDIVFGQYQIAELKKDHRFVRQLRYRADLILERSFVANKLSGRGKARPLGQRVVENISSPCGRGRRAVTSTVTNPSPDCHMPPLELAQDFPPLSSHEDERGLSLPQVQSLPLQRPQECSPFPSHEDERGLSQSQSPAILPLFPQENELNPPIRSLLDLDIPVPARFAGRLQGRSILDLPIQEDRALPMPARFAGRLQGRSILDLPIEEDQALPEALISLPEEPIPVHILVEPGNIQADVTWEDQECPTVRPEDKNREVKVTTRVFYRSDRMHGRPDSTNNQNPPAGGSVWARLGANRANPSSHSPAQEESKKECKVRWRKDSRCPVRGCSTFARHLKAHVMSKHLPVRFRSEALHGCSWYREQLTSLQELAFMLTGERDVYLLLKFVQSQGFIVPYNSHILVDDKYWMASVSRQQGWAEVEYSLHPPNSPAVLMHWRVLAWLLQFLSSAQRTEFHDLTGTNLVKTLEEETSPAREEPVLEKPAPPTRVEPVRNQPAFPAREEPVLEKPAPPTREEPVRNCNQVAAFDSHFHLDRTASWLQRNQDLEEILHVDIGGPPEFPLNVSGGVAVYCDPASFPSELILDRIPRGFGIAMGIHPKQSHQFSESLLDNIRQRLGNSRVVAMGEVGLDFTVPEDTWSFQEHVLIRMLSLAPSSMPVILHLRDGEHGNAYLKGYDILTRNSAPVQKVHLHCFAGSAEAVIMWNQRFPNCYFGLTALVRNFNTGQREALQRIPWDPILLETDSPYFRGILTNTPRYIGDTALLVAEIRGCSVEEICSQSLENGRRLYNL
ncbi:uncharacterized protein LOC132742946 [Ruditapes philippinarum]|uniref:uncharacterized protein LOC132742946 n=1 Tax=Ruditapes philippinarum TaxID=129788 RepID=UPI00295AC610|nr:uncharacterized protein LOC132742946 [Ruditapes philippinarum]